MSQNDKNKLDNEQELVWLLEARKNMSAFEPIFNKYHDTIFNYILRRTCNVALTEDLTANTFLKALNNVKSYKWKGVPLSSWLYRIATNEINLHFRKMKRLVPLTCQISTELQAKTTLDLNDIEETILKNEKFKKVSSALFNLKLKYQSVLTLRYFEEKSIGEISEILGRSENTIKTQIRRGLIQLRKLL